MTRATGEKATFWSVPAPELLRELGTSPEGLSAEEAARRLALREPSRAPGGKVREDLRLLLRQFKSPIVLLLLFAAVLSFFLHDPTDALIILLIVLVSGLLGFWQERGASRAVSGLLRLVQVRARVRREGRVPEVPVEEVVPGDVAVLSAGDMIPGDALLLESADLFVDEASLTGETFPGEKGVGVLDLGTPLARRTNSLFMGTHVVSGTALAVLVATGADTELGRISGRLRLRPPETEFERGIRHFGYLLLEVTLMLVIAIFAVNVYLARPVLQSFLFSLALAVGLTPQLLPAIISINLARGARRMAQAKVIVKRLSSIENFGSMNVLCSDKTGTLTEGKVVLKGGFGPDGRESPRVLELARINAFFESGFRNPIDEALRSDCVPEKDYRKVGEVPYDFVRKRLSIAVDGGDGPRLITKGALRNVLEVCISAEDPNGVEIPLAEGAGVIETSFERFSRNGWRVLGVASRILAPGEAVGRDLEAGLVFAGFLVFFDPPKTGAAGTVQALRELGVTLKIITGDNPLVAAGVAAQVGMPEPKVLAGDEIGRMSDEALRQRAGEIDVFAEVEPNGKERILIALKKGGNVVGYMGDGINDASALHAADVGISVDSAVDVAKEAADLVLLEKDLGVLVEGVRAGRVTFANTLKYVFMATSANFGNMFSMAGASLFLPFLPLLPKQILLTNLLTDFPEMAIAGDRVDPEAVRTPRRWDLRFIRRFMLVFGLLSSLFDYLTFGVLLLVFRTGPGVFRTGWFIESVVSATLIVLVVRTRRPPFRSRPSAALSGATLAVVVLTILLPWSPAAGLLDFEPLPPSLLFFLAGVVILYVAAAEVGKRLFYRFGGM